MRHHSSERCHATCHGKKRGCVCTPPARAKPSGLPAAANRGDGAGKPRREGTALNGLFDDLDIRMQGRTGVSRRRFIGMGAALGSAVLLGACGDDDDDSASTNKDFGVDEITIANWGGTTADGMMR